MKVSRIIAALAVTGLVLGGASQALARGHRGGGYAAGPHMMSAPMSGHTMAGYGGCPNFKAGVAPASLSGLTTEQQTELEGMFKSFHQSIESKRQELMAKQLELDALAANPSAPLDTISSLSKDIARLNSELNQAGMAFQDTVAEKFGEYGVLPNNTRNYGRNFVSHHGATFGGHHGRRGF